MEWKPFAVYVLMETAVKMLETAAARRSMISLTSFRLTTTSEIFSIGGHVWHALILEDRPIGILTAWYANSCYTQTYFLGVLVTIGVC